jgi:hypothetical protein
MACLLAQATRHFSAVRIPALQLLLGEFHNYRTATRMRERQKKRPFFQHHIPASLAWLQGVTYGFCLQIRR